MFRPHYLGQHLHKEFFEDDRKALLPLPFVASDELELKVVRTNGYAKFTLSKGKHTCSAATHYAPSQVFAKLTAYEVIVLDKNYRESTRHLRLYGNHQQESMDWFPYLTQLSRRSAALKYTGIYPMLPEKVQEFLDTCGYQAKKDTLKVLARLSEEKQLQQSGRGCPGRCFPWR